jgi:hypothetical protein
MNFPLSSHPNFKKIDHIHIKSLQFLKKAVYCCAFEKCIPKTSIFQIFSHPKSSNHECFDPSDNMTDQCNTMSVADIISRPVFFFPKQIVAPIFLSFLSKALHSFVTCSSPLVASFNDPFTILKSI